MNIYDTPDFASLVENNSYVGRGIVAGKSYDGKAAVCAYFIMGRSENSRNRVFTLRNGELLTEPFDITRVKDPSLIIYSALRSLDGKLIITNGDQTDTIYDFLSRGECFEQALEGRCFEPDAPNYTPRISALLSFKENDFDYIMSILKSEDAEGSACARYFFAYKPQNGLGHFIHTYKCDGDPIPSFVGEPERCFIPSDIDELTDCIWNALDSDNKISLYVRYTDLNNGEYSERLVNKNIL